MGKYIYDKRKEISSQLKHAVPIVCKGKIEHTKELIQNTSNGATFMYKVNQKTTSNIFAPTNPQYQNE